MALGLGGIAMKKYLNWITLFVLALLLVNGMLFYVLFSETTKLPSENWSRNYMVNEYEATDEVVYNVIYPTIYSNTYNGNIMTSFYSENQIHINFLDAELEIIDQDVFDVDVEAISDFEGFIDEGHLLVHYLKSQDEDAVYRYVYDLDAKELISSQHFEMATRQVAFDKDAALAYGENQLVLWDGEELQTIAENVRLENIALLKHDEQWNILTIESQNGQNRTLKRYVFDEGGLKLISDVAPQVNGSNYRSEVLDILMEEDHVKILSKIYNDKFRQNFIYLYNLDLENNQIALEYDYIIDEMSMTNSRLVSSPIDQIVFTQSKAISLGMRDISSKDETYFNLFLETYSMDGSLMEKMLTKTVHLSNHPNYFTFEGNAYLQWNEVRKGKNVIMYASDRPSLVSDSEKLMSGELLDLLWSVFSSNMLMLYYFLFISVSIAAPIILVIIPISLFFFSWAENNQDKLFGIALGVHLISKFYYIYNYLGDYAEVLQRLPGILSNQYFQYGISMATTIVAYYCLKDFAKRRQITNFLFRYLFFFTIDIILLVLILIPYRML